jgi:hypothetical protein
MIEMDEDGLGARLLRSGEALKLLNLSSLHLGLMVLANLDTVFNVFTDQEPVRVRRREGLESQAFAQHEIFVVRPSLTLQGPQPLRDRLDLQV